MLNCSYRLGLQVAIEQRRDLQKILGLILSLPFLPANEIEHAFHHILTLCNQELVELLEPFIQAYRNTWIIQVTPDGYSIFGLSRRTTNAGEFYHATLIRRFGIHSNPWRFICKEHENLILLHATMINYPI